MSSNSYEFKLGNIINVADTSFHSISSNYQKAKTILTNDVIVIQGSSHISIQGVEFTTADMLELKDFLNMRREKRSKYLLDVIGCRDLVTLIADYYEFK